MQRVCLLGCGNIAGIIAAHRQEMVSIVGCHDIDEMRMTDYAGRVNAVPCPTMEDLLECDARLLVEAASAQAVRDDLQPALTAGKDVVVLSVGALTDSVFQEEVRATASRLISNLTLLLSM